METQTQQLYLFKSRIPSCSYAFKKGKLAQFRRGEYVTSNLEEVQELADEIKLGHPMIYVDEKDFEVSPDRFDPIAALRKKIRDEIIAEELAKMQAATNPERDMGKSKQGPLNAASTSDIAPVAIGGPGSASLAALKSKVAEVANLQNTSK